MGVGGMAQNTGQVETVVAATVIWGDKTGAITENRMSLDRVRIGPDGDISERASFGKDPRFHELIRTAMFASESMPFDPMEKDIHEVYATTAPRDERMTYRCLLSISDLADDLTSVNYRCLNLLQTHLPSNQS